MFEEPLTANQPSAARPRMTAAATVLFALLLVAALLCLAYRPLNDPDFWWHLKSGEWMWQHRGLLQHDPFTFTGDGQTSLREALILKGYWLWQLLAYGLYAVARFNGIFLLNLLTLLALFVLQAHQLRRAGVRIWAAAPLLASVYLLISYNYAVERPQFISLLCVPIVLGQLFQFRQGGRLGLSLPLIMLLWGNLHGGFVVGDILLVLFAAGTLYDERSQPGRLRHALLWAGLGVLFSLLNPNGVDTFIGLASFYHSSLMTDVYEYRDTFFLVGRGRLDLLLLWLMVAVYLAGVWLRRRQLSLTELCLAGFLIWFSLAHGRNAGFFALGMLPLTGAALQRMLDGCPPRLGLLVGGLLLCLPLAGVALRGGELAAQRISQGAVSPFFPEPAAGFLNTSGLKGRLLNDYTLGGFQIWRGYPAWQVFIDGRGLDPKVYEDWKLIVAASLEDAGQGRPRFEQLLDHYRVDVVMLPLFDMYTGRITALVKFLINKPDWTPVYLDAQAYILARETAASRPVISRSGMDKLSFLRQMVAHLQARALAEPGSPLPRIARAELLTFLGRYAEARQEIEHVRQLAPQDRELPKLQLLLEASAGGAQGRAGTERP